jgi:hypothetical protein
MTQNLYRNTGASCGAPPRCAAKVLIALRKVGQRADPAAARDAVGSASRCNSCPRKLQGGGRYLAQCGTSPTAITTLTRRSG